MTLSLLIDLIMIVLLVLMIASTVPLNARLKTLKDSRKAFEALAQQFEASSQRADASIKSLHQAALNTGDDLQKTITEAKALRDELSIMIDSADRLAHRLGSAAGSAPQPQAKAAPAEVGPATVQPDPRSKAERELMNALKAQQQKGSGS